MDDKRTYLKEVKNNIYVIGKSERRYLKHLAKEINHMPHASYEALTEEFGTPKEIAESFLDEYDPSIIRKKVRNRKIVNITMTMISVAIVVMLILLYIDYKEGHDSYIEREETIIEEVK